ncbi:MAG: disulfide reductase, partial [Candidatus Hydrothermarchaeota archaeon]
MSREEPRIGVFVCHCGLNIAGVVDCKAVAEYAKTLPNVVYARDQKYSCSDSAQEEMKKIIKEHNLNRVVVASCSPRLHEPTFRKMVEEVGLNKYLFEMANIREHVSWVHANEPEKATEKAKDLVKMAVAKARLLEPLEDIVVPVEKACLVIGGGISGMRAALDLADMGFKVYLVEKEPSIGGVMAKLDKTFPTLDCSICIEGPVMSDVGKHENIELLAYHEVRKISGYIGNFEVEILKKRRGVSEECNGCGECEVVCPVVVPNEFDEGLGTRKAIYKPFPQAVPNMVVWDSERCIDCKLCELVCERDAVLREKDEEKTFTIKVGTIIVATGCKWY